MLIMKNIFSLLLAVSEQPTPQLQADPSVKDRLRSGGLYGPLYQVKNKDLVAICYSFLRLFFFRKTMHNRTW